MSRVPDFLLRRIYKKGSLRETTDGIAFELKNILGPGNITAINFIKINDNIYNSSVIKFMSANAQVLATHISSENPLLIKLNQEATCILEGAKGLQAGLNKIIIDIISQDIGPVQVTLTDTR